MSAALPPKTIPRIPGGDHFAEWVNAYIAACPDATIDYQATGSGAGRRLAAVKTSTSPGAEGASARRWKPEGTGAKATAWSWTFRSRFPTPCSAARSRPRRLKAR